MPLNPGFTDATVAATVHALSHNQLGAALDQLHFNVKYYGATGDGVVDDTAYIQAAFDAAYAASGIVYFPPGTYLCGTINWKYTPFRGAGAKSPFGTYGSVLLGKASQDIIHVAPSETYVEHNGWFVRDISFKVNDSVNAAASFPQRGGVGNAGFAVDFASGAGSTAANFLNQGSFQNVFFFGSSTVETGQNNSAGWYQQGGSQLMSLDNVRFYRLKYGLWQHYPTSNLTSSELANDLWDVGSLYFNGCGNAIRLVNAAGCRFGTLVIHGQGTTALQGVGVTSAIRTDCYDLVFANVAIESETTDWTTGWSVTGEGHYVGRITCGTQTGAFVIASSYSTFGLVGFVSTTGTLSITGNKNKILGVRKQDDPLTAPTVTSTGDGNLVVTDSASAHGGRMSFYSSVGDQITLDSVDILRRAGSSSMSVGSRASAGDVYIDYATAGNLYLRCTGSAEGVAMDAASRFGIGVTTGLVARLDVAGSIASRSVSVTYSASMTPNAASANFQKIVVTNGTAMTINAPTNPANGQLLTFDILNSSGGAMGAITWNAVFKLAGAFTNPANTKRRTISFYFDGTSWVETNRAPADI